MAQGLLNLPLNIPWKQIAVSPDMMDTQFCDKRFPFDWRPMIAISVFEPPVEETSEELCGQRLTHIKITITVTGYQPTRLETIKGYELFPRVPRATLARLLDSYFGCYGVLLNVAVFPRNRTVRVLEPQSVPVPEGDELTTSGVLTLSFPPAVKVQAKVIHETDVPVTMEVLAAGALVDSQTCATQVGETHVLESIEHDGIDQITLRCPEGRASVVEVTAFYPKQVPLSLNEYPHIVAFEPKTRDLYQAATDTGEVLTASKSGVATDKTLTHIDSTETGFTGGVKVPVGAAEISGSVSRKRTDTDEDRWSVQTDASRERRETQGTTTQLSQMYNLLTGYYAGSNRASFLMLPRPHVLQPTDHRTFVQGLRVIEGIQEFLLVVSRPAGMDAICIEAQLETGHFPEGEDPIEPEVQFEESFEDFTVTQRASGGRFSSDCASLEDSATSTFTIAGDKVIDRRPNRKDGQQGDPGHPGVKEIANNSNGRANDSLTNYNYRATSDTSVSVFGRICGRTSIISPENAEFSRTYRVLTRSAQPKSPSGEPHVPPTNLIISTRNVCVCMRSGDPCPEVISQPIRPGDLRPDSIVDERFIPMSASLLRVARGGSRTPAMKELVSKIQGALLSSWRQPRRYPPGEIGFLETDFFKDQVKGSVPDVLLRKSVGHVDKLPDALRRAVGSEASVLELLELDLTTFAQRTGLSLQEAAEARLKMLAAL